MSIHIKGPWWSFLLSFVGHPKQRPTTPKRGFSPKPGESRDAEKPFIQRLKEECDEQSQQLSNIQGDLKRASCGFDVFAITTQHFFRQVGVMSIFYHWKDTLPLHQPLAQIYSTVVETLLLGEKHVISLQQLLWWGNRNLMPCIWKSRFRNLEEEELWLKYFSWRGFRMFLGVKQMHKLRSTSPWLLQLEWKV